MVGMRLYTFMSSHDAPFSSRRGTRKVQVDERVKAQGIYVQLIAVCVHLLGDYLAPHQRMAQSL